MRKLLWIVAVAAVTFLQPMHAVQEAAQQGDRASQSDAQEATAPAATTDPYLLIYRTSGVRDNGAAVGVGVASVFLCTNNSAVPEKLAIQLRNFDGAIVTTQEFVLPSLRTFTASTHGTIAFLEDVFLSSGMGIAQGSARIFSSTPNMFCSAMVIDAASVAPIGVSLHLARSNAPAGVQE